MARTVASNTAALRPGTAESEKLSLNHMASYMYVSPLYRNYTECSIKYYYCYYYYYYASCVGLLPVAAPQT
jgi:hypothetical protein